MIYHLERVQIFGTRISMDHEGRGPKTRITMMVMMSAVAPRACVTGSTHRTSAESLLEVLLALFCQHVEGPAAAGKGPREWGYRHQECRAYKFNMICGRPRVDGFLGGQPGSGRPPLPLCGTYADVACLVDLFFILCVWFGVLG